MALYNREITVRRVENGFIISHCPPGPLAGPEQVASDYSQLANLIKDWGIDQTPTVGDKKAAKLEEEGVESRKTTLIPEAKLREIQDEIMNAISTGASLKETRAAIDRGISKLRKACPSCCIPYPLYGTSKRD